MYSSSLVVQHHIFHPRLQKKKKNLRHDVVQGIFGSHGAPSFRVDQKLSLAELKMTTCSVGLLREGWKPITAIAAIPVPLPRLV
jgi:hypothetical protein